MKMQSFTDLGDGRIASLSTTLTRQDGSTLVWPQPMLMLDHNIAATPAVHVNELDQVVTDLDQWHLTDLERGDIGFTITGPPTTREVMNLLDRYVAEARHLSDARLADWRDSILISQK